MNIYEYELNGIWKFNCFEPGEGEKSGLYKEDFFIDSWLDGKVPGMVHMDLYAKKDTDEPYYGHNALKSEWIETKEWWYKRDFTVNNIHEGYKAFLYFEGLDSFGKVWFNGVEIGNFDNMFIPYKYDVTDLIRTGQNFICIKFDSVESALKNIEKSDDLFACFNRDRVYLRKMQCSFGWDWAHKFVTCGIWKDVKILFRKAEIVDPFIKTLGFDSEKSLNFLETQILEYTDCKDSEFEIDVEFDNKLVYHNILKLQDNLDFIRHSFEIKTPKLWWPNGMGEQSLYRMRMVLRVGDEVFDEKTITFGIRKVELLLREDEKSVFKFKVNGSDLFIKGANWVPADSFPSSVSDDKYYKSIKLAKDAHYNMLRIWGGGIYESKKFYEFCDQLGIMVWQDFMFSCAEYPQNDKFLEQIKKEAEFVIKGLRNYPSLAVWCGNNEVGMNKRPDEEFTGKIVFDEILKELCVKFDGTRVYRPTTPYGDGVQNHLINNDPLAGDWHGGSWWTFHMDKAATDIRDVIMLQKSFFVSEFYAEGAPCEKSMKEFMPDYDTWPIDKELWEFHTKNNVYTGFKESLLEIMFSTTGRLMGESQDYCDLLNKTALTQGVVYKEEIEHYRRNRDSCSGLIFWMYNDCWPAISWSVVDYYLRPKLSYYYVKRAYAPVLLSFKKEANRRVGVYVINDGQDGLKVDIILYYGTTDGTKLKEKELKDVCVPANGLLKVSYEDYCEERFINESFIAGKVMLDGILLSDNVFFFTEKPGDVNFPEYAEIKTELVEVRKGQYILKLNSDKYVRALEIMTDNNDYYFSDNYFDIIPGVEKEIDVKSCARVGKNSFKFRALNGRVEVM